MGALPRPNLSAKMPFLWRVRFLILGIGLGPPPGGTRPAPAGRALPPSTDRGKRPVEPLAPWRDDAVRETQFGVDWWSRATSPARSGSIFDRSGVLRWTHCCKRWVSCASEKPSRVSVSFGCVSTRLSTEWTVLSHALRELLDSQTSA